MPRLNYTIPLYFDQSLSYLEMLGALSDRVEDIDGVFDKINEYFTFEDNKIIIKGDLAVTGELDSTTVVSKADEANKLSTPRRIGLEGVLVGNAEFDGTKDIYIPTSLGTDTLDVNVTGNATTATKLQTPRQITLAGNVTGTGTFDGTGNLTITTQVTGGSTEINSTAGDFTIGTGTNGGNAYVNGAIYAKDSTGNYVEVVQDGELQLNAPTATKLKESQIISLQGDVTGTFSFDGSESKIVSTTCGHATYANKLQTGLVGGTTQPVYIKADGTVTACTDYSQASVKYADSAGSASSCSNAVNAESATRADTASVSDTTNQIKYGTTLPTDVSSYTEGTVFFLYEA
jgi:Tfp pilus assembly protein FimT